MLAQICHQPKECETTFNVPGNRAMPNAIISQIVKPNPHLNQPNLKRVQRWAPIPVSGTTRVQNAAKYYLHNIHLTWERIRGNISPSGVNGAGKTQTKLENFTHASHLFSHPFLYISLPWRFSAKLQHQKSSPTLQSKQTIIVPRVKEWKLRIYFLSDVFTVVTVVDSKFSTKSDAWRLAVKKEYFQLPF